MGLVRIIEGNCH